MYIIKTIKRILVTIIAGFFFLLALLCILLFIPSVQQKITDIASSRISEMTGSHISIGSLYFKPFNRLDIRQVYAEDLQGDTLLYVDKLSAGFDLFSLLHNQLKITSVNLDDFLIDIRKDSLNGEANFQFLIDAFASEDTIQKEEKEKGLVISVNDVQISRGRLNYHVDDQQPTDSVFDPNHIRIRDFHSSFSLRSIDLERLNIRLRELSFREHSGFELSNLKAKINSRKEIITVEDFAVELPHSNIEVPEIKLDYTGADISRIADSSRFEGTLEGSILPSDLKAFYIPLAHIEDKLVFNGTFKGNLPSVQIETFKLTFGQILRLQAKASIVDYLRWQDSPLSLQVKELSVDPVAAQNVALHLTGTTLPEIVTGLGNVKLEASASGSLPAMKLQASLESGPGTASLSGKAGYVFDSGTSTFDVEFNIPDYDLNTLLQDTIMGKAGAQLWAKGRVNGNGQIQANAKFILDHFTYNKYLYKDITADMAYINDSLSINALSNDSNALFTVSGMYKMPPKGTHRGHIDMQLEHLSLRDLNLFPEYKISDIHASLRGDISGNTLDEYTGALQIDSLMVETEFGTFKQEEISLTLDNDDSGIKSIRLRSALANADISGKFSLETIATSFNNTLHRLTPSLIPHQPTVKKELNSLDAHIKIENTEYLSEALTLPFVIKKPGEMRLSYLEAEQDLRMSVNFPLIYFGTNTIRGTNLKLQTSQNGQSLSAVLQTMQSGDDTTKLILNTRIENDSVNLVAEVENKSMDMNGSLAFGIKFTESSAPDRTTPDIYMQIYPTSIHVKNQSFGIERSFLSMIGDTYTINNFKITHPDNGNILANGIVSPNQTDSLMLNFEHLHLGPFAEMAQYKGPKFGAVVNGGLVLKNLLESPLFFTKDLTVKEIAIADRKIGDMDILSVWSDKHQAVLLDINLLQTNNQKSRISGMAYPAKDSVFANVNIKDLELQWFEPLTQGMLRNLNGTVGASVKAVGKISKPTLGGYLYFNQATLGVAMTGVNYSVSDSIHFSYEKIDFQRFTIKDNKGNTATITGEVSHDNFEKFNVDVRLQTKDFLLLNNPEMKDSLFFGTLKAQANIHITGTEKGILLDGNIRKGTAGEVYVQIPNSQSEASRYKNIVYINTPDEVDEDGFVRKKKNTTSNAPALPIKATIDIEISPDIQMGVIINPSTQDAATVSGNGNMRLNYDMVNDEMSLLGDYTIEKGKCTISLKNLISREFTVNKGSKVTFKGDPLATSFNVSAIYSLKADLVTLDQSFANDLSNTRVTTNCILNVSGNMDDMKITYSLKFPNSDESIQRKVNNLVFSDEIMIKEVAYLLAVGSFYPPGGNQGTGSKTSIWTSLASSTLSSQLNNLLSGVLNENWSIGTSLRSNDDNFSDVEMDVNVSTSFLNDRLVVNTNLGYKNNSTRQNNFTGDFLVEYKLTKSGALRLKAYNITNDEYFKTSLTTQGVGVVYKKEAKTFKALFRETMRRINRLRRQNSESESDNKQEVINSKDTGGSKTQKRNEATEKDNKK